MIRLIGETRPVASEKIKAANSGLRALLSRDDIGFFKLPERDEVWNQTKEAAQRAARAGGTLAVLGIGGSSLGARAMMDAFALDSVKFFENVDARDFWERLEALGDMTRVHWAVISKSGQTLETLSQASFVEQYLEQKNLRLRDRVTVITESRKNPLFDWAQENQVPVLDVPLDVGGRFSVLSPVGLFPAAFAGLNTTEVRAGAMWALRQSDLISSLVAQAAASFEKQEWVTPFWIYCNRLYSFGLWIQQLWAESLAKKKTLSGAPAPRVSTPLPLIGANDQHSILQQVAEGANDKFIWFVRVMDSETFGPKLKKSLFTNQAFLEGKGMGDILRAEALATAKALQQSRVESLCIEVESISERSMGAMFMLMELVVGTLGEVLQINAFDQPGVELGKRLALDILK